METRKSKLTNFDWSNLKVINVNTFPYDKDLACLAFAVYHQEYGSKATYDISKIRKYQPKIKPLPDSWRLIATAECNVLSWSLSVGDGYHGAAYYNVSCKHLVIAHRGTELTNVGSLWTDVKGVIFSGYTSQMKSAYQFTRQIVDKFWESAQSITVTGHSLGGWLSQTAAFFIKNPDLAVDFAGHIGSNLSVDIVVDICEFKSSDHLPSHHLHVVSFDSPGALSIIESYLLQHHPRYPDNRFLRVTYLNELDVTTYFSSPNYVNRINMHIGSLFMMPNITTHKMVNIVQFWQSGACVEKTLLKITDWVRGVTERNLHHNKVQLRNEKTNTKFSAEPIDVNSIRMSVFALEEREFLEDIQYLKQHGIIGEKISWETMSQDKPIAAVNDIFSGGEFVAYTNAKNIFDFFDSFEIVDSQVLQVNDMFKIEFFIRLVRYFVKNSNLNLPNLVREINSDFPKVYQAIYRAFNTEYMNSIAEVQANDFPSLQEFLESSRLRVYQVIACESTLSCVAKITDLLKSKRFSFGGDVNIRLDVLKHTLFLSTNLLNILDRHVSIAKIVPPHDDLKLILIENSTEEMQPTLESLIAKVFGTSSLSVKLIFVTPKKINLQNHLKVDISPFYLDKEIGASDQAILFKHLSIEQQTKVAHLEICFQGEDMHLKDLISLEKLQSNSDILDQATIRCLLSPTDKISFGGHLNILNEFERSYYIPRHFHKIFVSVSKHITENYALVITYSGMDARQRILTDLGVADVDPFEWQGSFEGLSLELHKIILVETRTARPDYYSLNSFFGKHELPCLCLTYEGGKYHWESTIGRNRLETESIVYRYGERYTELEMLGLHRQVVIISDEPGMGKSTLMKNLAEVCKAFRRDTGKTAWVIFINLESHVDLFSEWTKSGDLESVTDLLSQIDGSTSSIGKCFLKYFLQQKWRVTVFFDGLDEVNYEIRSKVTYIAKTLLDRTKAKIFLGSRLHLRNTLEQDLICYTNTFLPLDESERVDFLKKFWIGHPHFQKYKENSIPTDVVASYARHLLQGFRISLNMAQADSFIGVPLQLFMFGTMTLPGICSILSEDQSNARDVADSILQQNAMIFNNIFDLYRNFVKEKCHISLKEKLKLKLLAADHPWHYQQLIEPLIELHRITSFRFIFPNACQDFDCSNSILKIEEIQAMLSVGIVQSDSTDSTSIQFIHRSLAEYFAADFLVSRLVMTNSKEKVINFLRKNFFLPQFEKVRYFIDHFIAIRPECHKIFRKCLDWKNEQLNIFTMLESLSDEEKENYDLLGRNVLHYAICYGDHEEKGILWCLMQNQHLFDKSDIFGCDFLSYIALLENVQLPYRKDCPWNLFEKTLYLSHSRGLSNFKWIIWFSGSKVESLHDFLLKPRSRHYIRTGPSNYFQAASTDYYQAGLEEIFCNDKTLLDGKQIGKFFKIIPTYYTKSVVPTLKLKQSCVCFSPPRQKSVIFATITLQFWKCSRRYLNVFEIAMTTNGAGHVDIAEVLYREVRDKNFDKKIQGQMLALMTRDNFALFKNCIEFFSTSDIEFDLWEYCKTQRKAEEMFDAVATTKFLTLRRILLEIRFNGHGRLVDEYFECYEKLKDENWRKDLIHMVRKVIDESLRKYFYYDNDYVLDLQSMLRFLPLECKEQIFEENYDYLTVIRKDVPSASPGSLTELLRLICGSVGPELKAKYEKVLDRLSSKKSYLDNFL